MQAAVSAAGRAWCALGPRVALHMVDLAKLAACGVLYEKSWRERP
jgi:hypothetical protein